MSAESERQALQSEWPSEFADGERCGRLGTIASDDLRGPGGYPRSFKNWQLERRNAWFAGFNKGYYSRTPRVIVR